MSETFIDTFTPTYTTEDGRGMYVCLIERSNVYGQVAIYSAYAFDEEGINWFEAHGVTERWIMNAFSTRRGLYLFRKSESVMLTAQKHENGWVTGEHPIPQPFAVEWDMSTL